MKFYKISALILPYGYSYGDPLISELSNVDVINHSSHQKAFQELKKLVKALNENDEISDYIRFFIEEMNVDSPNNYNVFEYDLDLNLIINKKEDFWITPFYGIEEKSNKHKSGDWVEFIHHGSIQVGIVLNTPLTKKDFKQRNITDAEQDDNSYTILYFDERDPSSHDHTQESDILGPVKYGKISNSNKKTLQERFKKNCS